MTTKLIESESVERDYGFAGTIAIVEHSTHGRLLIQDGYGEMDLRGGMVRWEHGMVIKLQPADTIESLRADMGKVPVSDWERMVHGYDDARPVLGWDGRMVAAIAKSAGLR